MFESIESLLPGRCQRAVRHCSLAGAAHLPIDIAGVQRGTLEEEQYPISLATATSNWPSDRTLRRGREQSPDYTAPHEAAWVTPKMKGGRAPTLPS